MEKEQIIVIGAGLFAEEINDLVSVTGSYEIMAYVEGVDRERCQAQKAGKPILWIDDLEKMDRSFQCLCAIGSPRRKEILNRVYGYGFGFITLIHPSAQIFPSASVLDGSMIGAGTIIAAGATLGKQVIVNRGCLIGHHSHIGDYVTISPGVNIAGKVSIGEGSYIGMGAIILDGIQIGANSVIGAGSLVTHDVPDHVQVMGLPARITKELR